jgi:hypothetical protein
MAEFAARAPGADRLDQADTPGRRAAVTGRPVSVSRLAAAAVTALFLLAIAACSATASEAGATARDTPLDGPAAAVKSAQPGSGDPPPGPAASCGHGGTVTQVSTAADLQSALSGAQAGTTIVLAPGVYQGEFIATGSGSSTAPITVCGSRSAVLQGPSTNSGYTLYLVKASWWHIEGFSVEGGQKGVVLDASTHNLIDGLYVHGTGDEAIHIRTFSSYNVVSNNIVRNTGLDVQFFGEGIYVGSAHKNWCKYTYCQPDRSNYNIITGNNVADTTAENVDIKEGTTGGTIVGNTFDGTGMVASAATAWVNVKGNGWMILDNTGVNTIGDGFQVHQVYDGWGLGNVFRGNKAAVHGTGYGIYVQSQDLRATVACSNVVTGGAQLSNVSCQH